MVYKYKYSMFEFVPTPIRAMTDLVASGVGGWDFSNVVLRKLALTVKILVSARYQMIYSVVT